MNLRIFDTTDDLLAAAARTLLQRVQAGARTIALSGGSTPQPMYAMLGSSPMREQLAEFPITWVVVDERYVPIDDPESNAGMMQRTLFANGISPTHRFLRFRTELNDPAATARAFEDEWRDLGITQLDLILLGIGDDGHTASLFPGTPVLAVEDRIASEVFVPRLDTWRVTITKPVIRAAALRLVLANGTKKKPILEGVRDGADYPIAQATNGVETWWLIDCEAAPD
ncbi:MAG: 6-phosphogluconolactonase [Acidobacteria bacterium]|nr:6-phosphogluconolactonase [Acidobacteriota bacterium]MBV9070540.1 6-phosphogluconolactonase [Acidobacteriota bacterium]MBV9188454.1 6-phosphogluconolactonase [Acidobacteriota bacterium]